MRSLRAALLAVGILACAAPAALLGQVEQSALAAVEEAMFFRRSALADTLTFDACSVYEQTGRPERMVERLRPGLRSLLDRRGDAPCDGRPSDAGGRAGARVRVDSVVIADTAAQVHLHVLRGGWRHLEVYHLTPRATGSWSLREVRMSPPLHTTPPPPCLPGTTARPSAPPG